MVRFNLRNLNVHGLLVAALLAFASPSWALVAEAVSGDLAAATASPAAGEPVSFLEAAAIPLADAGVVITPVPLPASVIEVLKPIGKAPKLRSAKKPGLAKPKAFPPILLSRTERHQLALFVASAESDNGMLRRFLHDENNESGYDELVLQRFYSRPKLASEPDTEDEGADTDDLSETVKLRLMFARLKAVEAHALAQVADPGDDLPEAIRQRLANARELAVVAHRRKFS
jgi:hypothetical protein